MSKGYEVIVLAPKDQYSDKVESWGVSFIDTPLQGTGTNPIKEGAYLNQLRTVFSKKNIDVALTYTIKSNIYSCLAARFCSTKVICNVSGLGTIFLTKSLTGKVAFSLYKVAFRHASHIFFQNEDDRELFTSKIKVDKEGLSVLPGSGIDLKTFAPIPSRATDQQMKFLMVSRLIIEKGVREYAEAASHFETDPSVSFSLVGKFDETHSRSVTRKELDKWVANGWLDYQQHSDEISKIIGEHDVVVLPSYREGTPRTLLEAAAHGRPLLTTAVPGCKEVVEDEVNGFLFEAKDGASLVSAIKRFLELTHEQREEMGSNSRKLVENRFDEKIVVDAYEQVIRRIIQLA